MRRLSAITPLGIAQVDRDRADPAPSLQCPIVLAAALHEMDTCRSEEGTEPAPGRVRGRQISPLEEIGEEALDDVTRFVSVEPSSSGEGVKGIPVIVAEPFQRSPCFGFVRITRSGDAAPLGRREEGHRDLRQGYEDIGEGCSGQQISPVPNSHFTEGQSEAATTTSTLINSTTVRSPPSPCPEVSGSIPARVGPTTRMALALSCKVNIGR